MERRKVSYEFEHAMSLEELAEKAGKREADGWLPSTQPREIAVQVAPHTLAIRFSQSFYRPEGAPASILLAPWAPSFL